jgi:hypothetical protein
LHSQRAYRTSAYLQSSLLRGKRDKSATTPRINPKGFRGKKINAFGKTFISITALSYNKRDGALGHTLKK